MRRHDLTERKQLFLYILPTDLPSRLVVPTYQLENTQSWWHRGKNISLGKRAKYFVREKSKIFFQWKEQNISSGKRAKYFLRARFSARFTSGGIWVDEFHERCSNVLWVHLEMYFLENQPYFWAHEPNLEICNKNCDQAPEAELPGMDFDATNHQKVTSIFYIEIAKNRWWFWWAGRGGEGSSGQWRPTHQIAKLGKILKRFNFCHHHHPHGSMITTHLGNYRIWSFLSRRAWQLSTKWWSTSTKVTSATSMIFVASPPGSPSSRKSPFFSNCIFQNVLAYTSSKLFHFLFSIFNLGPPSSRHSPRGWKISLRWVSTILLFGKFIFIVVFTI